MGEPIAFAFLRVLDLQLSSVPCSLFPCFTLPAWTFQLRYEHCGGPRLTLTLAKVTCIFKFVDLRLCSDPLCLFLVCSLDTADSATVEVVRNLPRIPVCKRNFNRTQHTYINGKPFLSHYIPAPKATASSRLSLPPGCTIRPQALILSWISDIMLVIQRLGGQLEDIESLSECRLLRCRG
ncbi:hypothetical protein BDQ17DRAFT_881257 [Cyathus striatus]|nr:hypothetical protein BDQ17DRAFT_881257 [Cyathus striatus]